MKKITVITFQIVCFFIFSLSVAGDKGIPKKSSSNAPIFQRNSSRSSLIIKCPRTGTETTLPFSCLRYTGKEINKIILYDQLYGQLNRIDSRCKKINNNTNLKYNNDIEEIHNLTKEIQKRLYKERWNEIKNAEEKLSKVIYPKNKNQKPRFANILNKNLPNFNSFVRKNRKVIPPTDTNFPKFIKTNTGSPNFRKDIKKINDTMNKAKRKNQFSDENKKKKPKKPKFDD